MDDLTASLNAPALTSGTITVAGKAVTGAARLRNAKIIAEELTDAGLTPAWVLAAVTNAYAESGLSADAIGDGGKSVGLFQLHENGAGKGMTTAQRSDPRLNTRRIAQEFKANLNTTTVRGTAAPGGRSMAAAYSAGATVADLAGLWAFAVEKPGDLLGEATKRAALARKLFPSLADLPATTVDRSVAGARTASTYALPLAIGLVSAAALAVTRSGRS